MNGLGIVLEESEPAPLRSEPPPLSPLATLYQDTEALLPPLPDEDGLGAPYATPLASPELSPVRRHSPVDDHHKLFSDIFSRPLLELDLSALNIAAVPTAFFEPAPQQQAPAPSTNTSPLKRLKSLKKGIRKLSLSKMSSSQSTSSTPTSEAPAYLPAAPVLSPLQSELVDPHHDSSLLSSTSESLRSSTFSALLLPAVGFSATAIPVGAYAAKDTPIAPTHGHSSSNGLGLIVNSRRRTLSNSQSNSAATTPPLPLPIITLLENLSTLRKNLVSIEQNFFDSLAAGSNTPSLASSMHLQQPLATSPNAKLPPVFDSISKLNTSDELIEYSIYLTEHKKSVETAYEVTKHRLSTSGWCSTHDLDNLTLQRESSLSQIDTKLLQIEEKLNSDFHLSMLNNPGIHARCSGQSASKESFTTAQSGAKGPFSPSLKVLESRCLSFSAEHGNFHDS